MNGGTCSVTRKLIQSRTEAQLSAKNPFSRRMEAPSELPGNLIQSRTEAQLSAENPFSRRMEAPGQLPGICFSLGLPLSLELRAIL